jgi:histidine ammonia-lyase
VARLRIGRDPLTLASLRRIAREGPPIALDPACIPDLEAAVAAIEKIVAAGEPAYGINTGFGKLAQTKISREDLSKLQTNLVLSHAAGTDPFAGTQG